MLTSHKGSEAPPRTGRVKGKYMKQLKGLVSMQGKIPTVFCLTFIIIIIILSMNKLPGWDESRRFYGLLLVGLYIIWLLLEEVKVSIREINLKKTSNDRGTCEVYALGRAAVVIAALALPTAWSKNGLWIPLGIGFFLFGVGIRLWAIWALGGCYSHRVRCPENRKIIINGPYRMVRHPAYTGMLLSHAGLVIFFFNWVSLVLLMMLFLPAIVARIFIEEKTLFSIQGYRDLFERKSRLIPFFW